jgi:hypothetical protein
MKVKTFAIFSLIVLISSLGVFVGSRQAIGQQTNVILLTSDISSENAMKLQNSFANSLMVVDSGNIVAERSPEALIESIK